ncbi:MAG: RNA polymerase subunit sigma-24 [Acidobacteria bacterium]|nr:MAG: RNA polymerase subunit sigma-24 [Acidobacteriota bacterium]PYU99858.1 MAG: RNA polymerase subunit sigma-24 [Acidobacteriota bacterium]
METTEKASLEQFESAALPHLDSLYRTAAKIIGNRTEAEDLVQETYLQAWKSFHRFTPGTNCRAWLFKILFHVIHHHRRKWFSLWLRRESENALEDLLTYEPPTPEQITDEDVLAALKKVPEDFRAVLLLADVQEFSYKEIAAMLSIPLGTVMSRLNRGRTALKTHLTPIAKSLRICTAEVEQSRA